MFRGTRSFTGITNNYRINKPENAQQIYKERWQIETAFRALKSSGFNIEDTHLSDLNRIGKLFSIVMIAFAWAYTAYLGHSTSIVGVFADKYIILKHGKRAESLFKHGLEIIATILLNPLTKMNVDVFKFLSCT